LGQQSGDTCSSAVGGAAVIASGGKVGRWLTALRFLYPFVSLFANFDLTFFPLLLDIPKLPLFRKSLRAKGFSIKNGIMKAT
jgi:hypothetical protein